MAYQEAPNAPPTPSTISEINKRLDSLTRQTVSIVHRLQVLANELVGPIPEEKANPNIIPVSTNTTLFLTEL